MPISIKPLLEPLSPQEVEDITLLMSESPALWSSIVTTVPINLQSIMQVFHQSQTVANPAILDISSSDESQRPLTSLLYGACFNGRIVGMALLQQKLTQVTSLKQDSPLPSNPKEDDHPLEEDSPQKEIEILALSVRALTRKRSVASQTLVRLQQKAEEEHWRLLLSKHKLKEVSFMFPTVKALGFTETQSHWVWPCVTNK